MKKHCFTGLILFVSIILLHQAGYTQNRVELLTPERVVLNDLMEGDTVFYNVRLKNAGSGIVDIFKVKATCKCTILDFKPGELKPGETMTIPVSIDTRGMRNRITKSISIQTSVEEQSTIKVYFELNVTQELEINPPYVNFQDAVVGKEQTVTLFFKNNQTNKMKIDEIEVEKSKTQLNDFNIEYAEKEIAPGASVPVTIRFLPDRPMSYYQILLLHIDGTTHSPYKIPVYIMVHEND